MGIYAIIHRFKLIFQISTYVLAWQFHLPATVHDNEKGNSFVQWISDKRWKRISNALFPDYWGHFLSQHVLDIYENL